MRARTYYVTSVLVYFCYLRLLHYQAGHTCGASHYCLHYQAGHICGALHYYRSQSSATYTNRNKDVDLIIYFQNMKFSD